MENKTKLLILRESYIQSFFADLTTFAFIASTCWFNYKFVGNSKFLSAIILIMFILFLIQKSGAKTFYSKKEAISYIDNK